MSPRTLYQATHAEVMFSRSVRVWIGPARNGEPSRTRSVLSSPDQPFEHQCLAVMYCGVLTSGVRVMDCVPERVALASPVDRGVAQRALDEAGVLDQRALPAGDQPGVGVDDDAV
jgi:hypothetical protein